MNRQMASKPAEITKIYSVSQGFLQKGGKRLQIVIYSWKMIPELHVLVSDSHDLRFYIMEVYIDIQQRGLEPAKSPAMT